MEAVVLVIHLIVALGIIVVVLVQPSEAGGFLGSGGSMSNMMAPRRTADALTRTTTILAGIFFLTSLTLAIIAERGGPAKSILDVASDQPVATQEAPTEPAPDASTLKTVPAKVDPVAPAAEKAKPAAPKKGKPEAPISK